MSKSTAPARRRVICTYCHRLLHMQRNGAWYHNHNGSVSCYPGQGSEKRAVPIHIGG